MGNSNSHNANTSSPCTISGRKGTSTSRSGSHNKSSHTGHSSSSSSSSAKITAVLGTLSHSVVSSLTTDTSASVTTSTEQSSNGGNSSLGTSNHSHSGATTTDEEKDHKESRGPFYENHHFYYHHQQQQQHHFPNITSRNRPYNSKQCNDSTDSLNCTDVDGFADSPSSVQRQHHQQQHGSHYSFSDAGMHIASSFELVQPIELHAADVFNRASASSTVEPLSLLPQYRPHSVLGLNEQLLHHSMSSCTTSRSVTTTTDSTDSCCSSGEQSSLEEADSSSHYSRIEHFHHQRGTPANKAFALKNQHLVEQHGRRQKGKRKSHSKSQGIRVAVMPRSKSFHQILRPTANGQILASNGTIRGASKQRLVAKSSRDLAVDEQQQPLQPLANRGKLLFSDPKTTTSNSSSSKNYSSGEKRSELESILQARLSKSESNLQYRQYVNRAPSVDLNAKQRSNQYHHDQSYQHNHYHLYANQQHPEQPQRKGSSESFRKLVKPQKGNSKAQQKNLSNQQQSVSAAVSKSAGAYVPNSSNVIGSSSSNGGSNGAYTSASPVRTSRANSKEGSISKHSHSAVAGAGNVSGAVAAKVQRVKQNRNNQTAQQQQQSAAPSESAGSVQMDKSKRGKQRDLSPLSKSTLNYFSTQEISNELMLNEVQHNTNSGDQIEKSCKIKRSVSNFDASVYFRQHDIPSTVLSSTTVDSPWKLQKPNYNVNTKNNVPDWYSQYLSFEFLNERIKSRLQEEINYQRRSIATDNSSICDYSRQDSAYQTSRSEDSKQHLIARQCFDRGNAKLSCSEANLSTPNTPKTKAKGSNGLGKRKSFKKLIEQYFVHNNSSCDSSTSSLASYANEPSTFAKFDQNFILKRNTPNAGLSEQKFQQQSNIKEYFDNEQSIYERTLQKKRPSQSTHSGSLQCLLNGRGNFSTIDRQLQMFENILNQAESQIDDNDQGLHKSNLSLTEQTNSCEFVQQNVNSSSNSSQMQYLKLIGKSDNSLSANNIRVQSKTCKTKMQHRDHYNQNTGLYWTPLNDLSSESEFEDEFEYDEVHNQANPCPEPVVTELFADNLVDIDIEDFNCHHFRAAEPPVPMPRQHITTAIATKLAESQYQSSGRNSENNTNVYNQVAQIQSSTSKKDGIHLLPSGPCFTLSNQLKTLLHNSNRLKSQNYFFY